MPEVGHDEQRGTVKSLFYTFLGMIPRAGCTFLGLFLLANLAGGYLRKDFSANILLLGFDSPYNVIWLPLLGVVLLTLAWRRPSSRAGRLGVCSGLYAAGVAIFAAAVTSAGAASGLVRMSFLTTLTLLGLGVWSLGRETPRNSSQLGRIIAFVVAMGVVTECFLLAQLYLFGSASSGRQADCIVVLGAAVNRDGSLSLALTDRTLTGCRAYHRGLAPKIILSGGVTYGVSEPQAMARLALLERVPPDDIIIDEGGYSTYGSAQSVRRIMERNGWRSAIIVSHNYHLSRTWLAFRRAGTTATTLPAKRSMMFPKHDLFQACRESAAWAYYWLRPMWEPLEER